MKIFLQKIGIVLGIFGIFIMITMGADGIASFKSGTDLYDIDTDYFELSRLDLIDTEFDVSLGCFVEEETTTKNKYGSVTNRSYKYYYAIPAYSGEDTYWIGLEISSDNMRTMDQIVDETYDYLMGEDAYYGYTYLELQGRLTKLEDEKYDYMVEMFEELEWYEDDDDIEKYVLPVCITTFDPASTRIFFIVGVVGILLGILSIVSSIKGNASHGRRNAANNNANNSNNSNTANTNSEMVTIGGTSYPKSYFERVNNYIEKNELEYAVQDLWSLTGLSSEEAREVVNNWNKYYH